VFQPSRRVISRGVHSAVLFGCLLWATFFQIFQRNNSWNGKCQAFFQLNKNRVVNDKCLYHPGHLKILGREHIYVENVVFFPVRSSAYMCFDVDDTSAYMKTNSYAALRHKLSG
ncbi:unnamed protein product, partial [Sphacelaria rigidula]